jgi:DNA-binding CsgD family transcriptional regulator
VTGLLERSGAALSPRLLMAALQERFDLGEVKEEELTTGGASEPSTDSDIAGDLALVETAAALIAELSPRQLEVLRRTDSNETIERMATALACSVGTIVNEQRRVGATISRFSETDEERIQLLRIVRDHVYRRDETDE